MVLRLARVVWFLLPATAGGAIDEATRAWSGALRVVALVLALATWLSASFALLVPRPRSFTVLRIAAPGLAIATTAAALDAGAVIGVVATAHAWCAAACVLSSGVAHSCADGASYGNERRFPLRLPPQFALLIVPLSVALVGAIVVSGPLLLAAEQWIAGGAVFVAGVPIAVALARSLRSLERRFVVIVPAGVVVSDGLTLVDPVLFPSDHLLAIGTNDDPGRGLPDATPGLLDLRLGAVGAVELRLDTPAPLPLRAGRRDARTVEVDRVLFTPIRPRQFLDTFTANAPRGDA